MVIRAQRTFLIIFLSAFILGVTFLFTGYSFSWNFLDVLLFTIIVLYPIVRFFQSQIKTWIKALITLLVLTGAAFMVEDVLVFLAFSRETEKAVRNWRFANRQITLNTKQGWAGGPYSEFKLTTTQIFGLIRKVEAVGYYKQFPIDSCKIDLKRDYYDDKVLFEFDTCRVQLRKMRKK